VVYDIFNPDPFCLRLIIADYPVPEYGGGNCPYILDIRGILSA
jgi:hypothetical protein